MEGHKLSLQTDILKVFIGENETNHSAERYE